MKWLDKLLDWADSTFLETPCKNPMLKTKLHRFQKEGIRQIQRFGGRALLGDEVGLGKTIQALGWSDWNDEYRPIVVVCPAGIKFVWTQQANEHFGWRGEVLSTRTPPKHGMFSRRQLFIINYDVLWWWVDFLRKLKPQIIILDEIHEIRNIETKKFKATNALCHKVPYVIGLSGTALVNRPADLWAILHIIKPKMFPSRYAYLRRYCAPERKPWGWVYKGATNLGELHRKLKRKVLIRRRKKDVLGQLPELSRIMVPLEIENRDEYNRAIKDFRSWYAKIKGKPSPDQRTMQLDKLGELKRLAASLKLPAVFEWVDNYFQETGDKLVTFAWHRKIIAAMHQQFPKSVILDGSVAKHKRQAVVDRFHLDKKVELLLGNIQAAGQGWSCKATPISAMLEIDWVPGRMMQCEGRAHGLGRGVEGKISQCYWLVAHGTIEEKLCEVLQIKQGNIDAVLDGKKGVSNLNVYDELTKLIMKGGKK